MTRGKRALRLFTAFFLLQAYSPLLPPPAGAAEPVCPAPGKGVRNDLRFLVLGDWGREGRSVQREVARQMGKEAEEGADFVITTGDNFYQDGVTSVKDPAWEKSFQEVYTSPCLDIPWHPVFGNHDYRGNTAAQIEYSYRDSRWTMPERYYALRRQAAGEEAIFVFLDTNSFIERYRWTGWRYPDLADQDVDLQLAWLEKTLAASSAEWKIVIGHHPVYTGGTFHGPSRDLRERVVPLFRKYGVRVYFAGHEHNLQHLKPPGPTHYVISGGGSGSRPAGTVEDTLFAAGVPGFVAAALTKEGLRLRFTGGTGEVLYETSIPR
jgi:acid phosphatase